MDALQKEFMMRAERLQATLKQNVLQRKQLVIISLPVIYFKMVQI